MPHLAHTRATRFWLRVLTALARRRVIELRGVEHIAIARDPFILAINHSQRFEAILIPTLLTWLRQGRLVHFFTDWLVLLYPIVAQVVLLHGPIIVTRKQARLRWLNWFKRRYENLPPPFERAAELLKSGTSVGIFPEGTMNRDRARLLRGYSGAAQLSMEQQVPVVPAGVRFPKGDPRKPVGDWEPWVIEFGPPMAPPKLQGRTPEIGEIRDWHASIMQAISVLSGKQWTPENQRKRYVA